MGNVKHVKPITHFKSIFILFLYLGFSILFENDNSGVLTLHTLTSISLLDNAFPDKLLFLAFMMLLDPGISPNNF